MTTRIYRANRTGADDTPENNQVFPALELPSVFFQTSRGKPTFDSVNFPFPASLCTQIEQQSRTFKVTNDILLQAAFCVILYRYSEQTAFTLCKDENDGSTTALSFVNILIDEKKSFADLCTMIAQAELKPAASLAFYCKGEHGNTISESILPLCKAIFLCTDAAALQPQEIAHTLFSDIIFSSVADNSALTGTITFNSNKFRRDFIQRMCSHFVSILSNGLDNTMCPVESLELLSSDEIQLITKTWNSTSYPLPESAGLGGLFDIQVEKHPDSTALITDSQCMSFRELSDRVNILATALIEKGIKPEHPVAVCMDRSFELIISILAIIKSGGTYVPLDPSYPQEHLSLILEDCSPSLILTKESFRSLFDTCDTEIFSFSIDFSKQVIPAVPVRNAECTPENRFYIMYTSGSSGKQKGVEGIYRGILSRLFWMWDIYPYTENDICCHRTPIGFVDHIAEILAPLLKGVPLIIASDRNTDTAAHLVDFLIANQISRILIVPSLLHSILHLDTEVLLSLTSLRYVFSSGEPLDTSLVKLFYQHLKNARLVNIYGSTEVSADATFYEVKRFFTGDVLRYFRQSIDLPGSLKDTIIDGYSNPIQSDRITSENIPVEVIASKFRSSEIADFPIAPEQYFKRLYSDVFPYVINTAAPTYIGHMTSALPDFVHDLSKLISQLNQNLVKIETAKSLIFVERETLAILHRCFFQQNDQFYNEYVQKLNANLGLVTTGGTTANITALLTARNKALFSTYDIFSSSGKSIYRLMREKGYEDMTILGTHRMHYSIRKAISVLGLGIDTIRYVATDDRGRLDTKDLEEKIEYCRNNKILVIAIIGIAGSTETGQIDPLDEIGIIAQKHGIHFHVDAAWGGTMIFSERYKGKLNGIDKADSITFCGHKQLYLPQGISICLFKDPDQLQFATTTASYQATSDSYDVGKFTLEGSRSAISLCLHAALQLIGKKGYEALVNYSMDLTAFFARTILLSSAFELIGTPELNIVNYRYIPRKFKDRTLQRTLTADDNREINEFNTTLQEHEFLKGKTFVSKTTLTRTTYASSGLVVFRVVLSNPLTTYADLYEVLEDQLSIAQEIDADEQYEKFHDHYQITVPQSGIASLRDQIVTTGYSDISVPIGKPLYNCTTYIFDKKMRLCPIGIPGELFIGGAATARGYYNNPELTDSSFVKNPFEQSDTLFKTGDRARYSDDGSIEFLGRLDDQVKISGYRIEPSEIEYYINQSASVCQCKVTVKTDANGNRKLIAFIVLEKDGSVEKIKQTLDRKLPGYMIPSEYRIIDQMPLLPNGKIDKGKLLQEI